MEAWRAGLETTNALAMMLGVHGAEEIGGGFALRFALETAPVQSASAFFKGYKVSAIQPG